MPNPPNMTNERSTGGKDRIQRALQRGHGRRQGLPELQHQPHLLQQEPNS